MEPRDEDAGRDSHGGPDEHRPTPVDAASPPPTITKRQGLPRWRSETVCPYARTAATALAVWPEKNDAFGARGDRGGQRQDEDGGAMHG
jgi:hypothetical protein